MNFPNNTLQAQVFSVLKDKKWHCRGHEYKEVPSGQLAGGGGIQGLQRGTKSRNGCEIERKTEFCQRCSKKTVWDRWTGKYKKSNAASSIPKNIIGKILEYYDFTDSIEKRKRSKHELIVDHRFPMERWGATEEKLPRVITNEVIEQKFQLLKKDNSGNHNLLKSRACEICIKTGKRGAPLGVKFYYIGNEHWPKQIPQTGADAEKGCIGCGWYDFNKWRMALNDFLNKS